MKPKLAAFPKCYMDELCVHHTMTVFEWIDLAATLGVDGLEFYWGFLEDDQPFLSNIKSALERHNLAMPMLCCSPDFTEPDPLLLQKEIDREKRMIEITAFFGGRFCRVLSGQRRPELNREEGVAQVVRVLKGLLPFAEANGVVLTMENHYKDNYWQYPEFAQKMDVFVEIVDQIDSPWFGVNFDPSNTILAGEDPLVLLDRVKHRVVTDARQRPLSQERNHRRPTQGGELGGLRQPSLPRRYWERDERLRQDFLNTFFRRIQLVGFHRRWYGWDG